jgi:hypothetical protein
MLWQPCGSGGTELASVVAAKLQNTSPAGGWGHRNATNNGAITPARSSDRAIDAER